MYLNWPERRSVPAALSRARECVNRAAWLHCSDEIFEGGLTSERAAAEGRLRLRSIIARGFLLDREIFLRDNEAG